MTPRTRFEDLDAERRESMLAAAAREFAENGYEAASVNRIIERAGISKGTLYYYFDDKEDLFATALRHAFVRFLENLDVPHPGTLDADDFWDTFRVLGRRSLEHIAENEWYVQLARSFHRFRLEHAPSPSVEDLHEWSLRSLGAYLARGQELGVVRTDLPLDLLVAMTRGLDDAGDRWMLERWDETPEAERARLFEARLDAMRDMLDAEHQGWER